MANAIVSRFGQVNEAGDPFALFLKIFSGEVLAAYLRQSAFREKHLVRTIPSGKTAQFPTTGLAGAYYHVPGQEIRGGQIGSNERNINIEDMLIAPVFVSNIDELVTHFDVRGIYSEQIGNALAKSFDQNVSRVLINAARNATPNVAGLPAGTQFTDADFDTDGTKLWAFVFNAGVTLDQHDVPSTDRYAGFRPVQYALIVRSEKPINRNFNPADNGSLQKGDVREVNSVEVFKTNNLVQSNDIASAVQPASRQHDYSVTRGIVFHRSSAGTVALQDVTMETFYDPRRQGTMMLGKYVVGHDQLRPEGAIEARTGAPAG